MKLHNTLTGRKEIFVPARPGRVGMYVCGVTVYDYCHLGHARSALVFDVLRRYLEHEGHRVTFVKNFTDVDDKIINRAREQGVQWQDVTSKYIAAYYEDMKKLGVRAATIEPKATEHMSEIIGLVESLLDKGMAYLVDGDVYFAVEKFSGYGMLSKRKLADLQAGARVEVDERKRHPMDFALWKAAKPGEPSWESPWGRGRPGWHIECSAMAMKHLAQPLDIHGGGEDLIFPHHENEIAQSSGATGVDFARFWVHNGFVRVNQEKMSKSVGNFFTIREIFAKCRHRWPDDVTGEMLRYFLLSRHYRGPVDFSDLALEQAKRALDAFFDLFVRLDERLTLDVRDSVSRYQDVTSEFEASFFEAMDDDLNTPLALAAFQRLRTEVNKIPIEQIDRNAAEAIMKVFQSCGRVLGLFQIPVKEWKFNPVETFTSDTVHVGEESIAIKKRWSPVYETNNPVPLLRDEEIQKLVDARNEARRRKDFKKADQIRTELLSAGITIEDRPDGTSRWKR